MDPNFFIWLLILMYALVPALWRYQINQRRLYLFRRIQAQRGTRVITLIHRQESLGLLGIPIARYIDIEDSEQVLRAIRLTPPDRPIDLILHTPGGLVLAAEQIARALAAHPAKVTVFVPHYAMSGGTLLALAADEIIMDPNAALGPVDPQIGQWPAASILNVLKEKGVDKVDDQTLIMADLAVKAIQQVEHNLYTLLQRHMPPEDAARLAKQLSHGRWTHDYPLTLEELQQMGLKARTGVPGDVYRLMELYPQPASRRPNVQYIPDAQRPRGQAHAANDVEMWPIRFR
ncbi:MAG TPA: ATP-dependent Clp protease proteolytic subunit [Sphingobacteriaceae bacterium]|nr:ATP-dependent Clp protease proteolytic subunit [Sphingobacteriaceae bacterium]